MPFYLEPGIPILLSRDEPEPVQRAARDLQRDLRKVFGTESPIVHSTDAGRRAAIAILSPHSKLTIGKERWIHGREAHQVIVAQCDGTTYLLAQGADIRGAIYAIYSLSEHLLGIPPLWFWASWEPTRQQNIEVPVNTNLRFPTPYVKYRAWFPNDTSRLSPWSKRSPDNASVWAETMLRLKLNTIVLDNILSGSTHLSSTASTARSYGLIVSSTHISPFGQRLLENWNDYWLQVKGTPPPKLSLALTDELFEMWAHNMECILKENIEIVWTLAFRGARDHPFWEVFDDAPATEKERAAILEAMLEGQLKLLREKTRTRYAPVRTTLYNEVSDFFAKGMLKLPDDPSLIYNFVSARRDHFPPDRIRDTDFGHQPLGYYMNFQFTSTGSHFAQAEGPWKTEHSFKIMNALSKGPLEFIEVNIGNIREHVVEGAAAARMMWSWDEYQSDSFMNEFFKQYFGDKASPQIAQLYKDFLMSYWQQRKPTIPGFARQYLFQDLRYLRTLLLILQNKPGLETGMTHDEFLRISPEDNGANDVFEAIRIGYSQSIEKLCVIEEKANLIMHDLPEQGKRFYQDIIQSPVQYMLLLNNSLHAVVTAHQVKPSDPTKAYLLLLEGQHHFTSSQTVLSRQDHGMFSSWMKGMNPESYHYRTIMEIRRAFQTNLTELAPKCHT
ncbi:hypothetical protein PAESOLCIP111_00896 [Paenibacillus solanacearum]|uniref:Uncharacterized protein n=1 Tax=Paenibacillus solanacearum TaxID=2048548 RepID=A0A916JVC6_9BACL|nr:glycosyl hydrolase 115 family protein [Paenibacillus solanacearum]CAG7606248.1 hypothetical protein PAESOLCIP111_00896 [Paenibacillus solanacearum]